MLNGVKILNHFVSMHRHVKKKNKRNTLFHFACFFSLFDGSEGDTLITVYLNSVEWFSQQIVISIRFSWFQIEPVDFIFD